VGVHFRIPLLVFIVYRVAALLLPLQPATFFLENQFSVLKEASMIYRASQRLIKRKTPRKSRSIHRRHGRILNKYPASARLFAQASAPFDFWPK
jgi:hypothetical protein